MVTVLGGRDGTKEALLLRWIEEGFKGGFL